MTRNGTGTSPIVFDIDGALLTTGGAAAMAWGPCIRGAGRSAGQHQ